MILCAISAGVELMLAENHRILRRVATISRSVPALGTSPLATMSAERLEPMPLEAANAEWWKTA